MLSEFSFEILLANTSQLEFRKNDLRRILAWTLSTVEISTCKTVHSAPSVVPRLRCLGETSFLLVASPRVQDHSASTVNCSKFVLPSSGRPNLQKFSVLRKFTPKDLLCVPGRFPEGSPPKTGTNTHETRPLFGNAETKSATSIFFYSAN